MSASPRQRRVAGFDDVFLVFALACLLVALLYPWIGQRESTARAESAVADVELLSAAASSFLEDQDRWPADDALPGIVPADLTSRLPAGFVLDRDGYLLDWERWEVVVPPSTPGARGGADILTLAGDSIGPPPVPRIRDLAGITVVTSDPTLLGVLLRRFGPSRSFVRDRAWTLVLGGSPFTSGS